MELTAKYLEERINSLGTRLGQFQQQYFQTQQVLEQTQANINAAQGAISDSKEILAYLKQEEPVPAPTEVVQKASETLEA